MLNKIVCTLSIISLSVYGFSQDCSLKISGYTHDLITGSPLEANVYINEINKGTVSDNTGFFQLHNLCPGEYHISFSHISCESQQYFIQLKKDTSLKIVMKHSINTLDDVIIIGKIAPTTTQESASINEQNIRDNFNQSLSDMLESISGVSAFKTGSNISKLIVQGLYGNRLTILNNGIEQSGQQWGNEHSPEIDPLVANKISVIKGVSTLEYMGSNLGSVVLVNPKKIEREPHLHGKVNYFFESNGLSNGLNLQLQQYAPAIAWKINGTLKKSGDKKTPDYYLNNTGNQEANFALQLEKSFSSRFTTGLYFSTFNLKLGILRGAHISNLTDLKEALNRKVPFFTEDKFSYVIDPPRQKVNHQLLKIHSKYFINDKQWLHFTIAGQFNSREEFDIRRGGRSKVPALSLQQYSYFFETKHYMNLKNEWSFNTGLQVNIIDNKNNPETGILPLIPDYLSYKSGVYTIATKRIRKSFFEVGLRYEYTWQNVVTITRNIPTEIVAYTNMFYNFSSSVGWIYQINKDFNLSYNLGYATRNPAINELYSFGVHQGVSGIEEGNINLGVENSVKSTLGFNSKIKDKLSFDALVYYQGIRDYIFLNPQKEIRLTIRGSFPVFKYEQTDAHIYGLDLSGKYQISQSISSEFTYSFIRGNDIRNDIPLINIPSNNIRGSVGYEFPVLIKIGKQRLENLKIELKNKYVFKQHHLLPEQDFVLPPKEYNLLGFKLATNIQLGKIRCRLVAKIDNLLNVTYREYLNRQRYFADDLGINATLGVSLKF